jgi:hypothetical protein
MAGPSRSMDAEQQRSRAFGGVSQPIYQIHSLSNGVDIIFVTTQCAGLYRPSSRSVQVKQVFCSSPRPFCRYQGRAPCVTAGLATAFHSPTVEARMAGTSVWTGDMPDGCSETSLAVLLRSRQAFLSVLRPTSWPSSPAPAAHPCGAMGLDRHAASEARLDMPLSLNPSIRSMGGC